MKKLTVIVLMAGLSVSTTSIAAAQNNGVTNIKMTFEGPAETLSITTRPRRPRPPHLSNDMVFEVGTRPGRPRPPHFSDALEERLTGEF